jgi:hypothetical protein
VLTTGGFFEMSTNSNAAGDDLSLENLNNPLRGLPIPGL